MKKYYLATLMLFALTAIATAQTWTNDPAHSRLGFTIKHMTISEVSGRFADFTIKATTAKPDQSDLKVELTAQIASIDTDVEARDKHLKSPDFFDSEKYPTLTFVSSYHKKLSKDTYKMVGNLTMHGITKSVTLTVKYFGEVVNPMSNKKTVGFQITGSVKRSDFGIGPKFPEAVLSDDVNIIANAEFTQN